MSRLISAFMITALSMFLMICIFSASANPLPSDVEWEGTGGAHPLPGNTSVPIHLKEEFVKAVVHGDEAGMTCVYTFGNHGETDALVEITLPFVEDPKGLRIKIDGERCNYQMGFYHYEPLTKYIEHMMEYEHLGLTCLIFPLEIDAGGETEVKVEYDTPISVYDSRALGGEISYWYCYLVGSGRYWSQPIERARFEVRMPSNMYSEHVSEGWEKHRAFTKLVFEREFENWVPDQDLIVLEWKKIDPVPLDTGSRAGICFGAIGAELVLIAIVMVYIRRKSKKGHHIDAM